MASTTSELPRPGMYRTGTVHSRYHCGTCQQDSYLWDTNIDIRYKPITALTKKILSWFCHIQRRDDKVAKSFQAMYTNRRITPQ